MGRAFRPVGSPLWNTAAVPRHVESFMKASTSNFPPVALKTQPGIGGATLPNYLINRNEMQRRRWNDARDSSAGEKNCARGKVGSLLLFPRQRLVEVLCQLG